MATTYNNLFLDTRARLKKAGVESAQLEAREIICFAADKSREQFYRDMSLYVSGSMEQRVEELVQRRLAGEPVAYIIGEWEFYGLSLDVSRDVLIPRLDTELLAERGILKARESGEGARILDLCAGSGCVGLAVAHGAPETQVMLGELDPAAIRVCRENIRRCGLAGRAAVMRLDALQPPPRSMGEFACVVSNPPYIPDGNIPGLDRSVRDFEPHLALMGGADGYDFYRAIVRQWRDVLAPGGRIGMVLANGPRRAALF